MRSFFACLGFLCLINSSRAQFKATGRELVDSLCSPYFFGRGYVNEGCSRAAYFLANRLSAYGLDPLFNEFFQEFPLTVNTFPKEFHVQLDKRNLKVGRDFQPHWQSPSAKGSYRLVYLDSLNGTLPVIKSNEALAIPKNWFAKAQKNKAELIEELSYLYPLVLEGGEQLLWSVGHDQFKHPVIEVINPLFWGAEKVKMRYQAVIEPNYFCNNVCAVVKGTQYPDSFLFLTAHYDHLGGMGQETYLSGANDNASGTAMLLSLAKYFNENPPKYSIAFVAFAAEEAGLVGSKYFVERSGIDLKKIKFLFNLDLMGTGATGATVVNATLFPLQFDQLKKVNDNGHYLSVINPRGEAANSDHYWFTKAGVPSFFMYLQDPAYTAYHNIHDRPQDLPLSRFDETCKLIIDFLNSF